MASFWTGYALPTAIIVAEVIAIIVPLLLAIAYFTYAERKVLAYSQLRKGPNVVGPFGLFQPIADGVKLLLKETIVPSGANRLVFLVAPILTFTLSLVILDAVERLGGGHVDGVALLRPVEADEEGVTPALADDGPAVLDRRAGHCPSRGQASSNSSASSPGCSWRRRMARTQAFQRMTAESSPGGRMVAAAANLSIASQ